MQYFTSATKKGPVLWKQFPFPLMVVEAPETPKMIGMAAEVGVTAQWHAVWSLQVHGAQIPGFFVIIDGRFEPIEARAVLPVPSRLKSQANLTQSFTERRPS